MARKKAKAKKNRKRVRTVGPRTGGFVTSSAIRRAGAEVKSIDLDSQVSAKQSNYAGTLLNGCAQNTTVSGHIGRKINLKSLLFRYMVHLDTSTYNKMDTNASATLVHLCYRVLIVYDKQSNGAAPTQSAILQTPTNALDWSIIGNNLDNRDRFKVIYDKKGRLCGADPCHIREKYIKLKGREVMFQGTGATINDISTGSLYLWVIQDQDPAGTATPQVLCTFVSRIRFLDN